MPRHDIDSEVAARNQVDTDRINSRGLAFDHARRPGQRDCRLITCPIDRDGQRRRIQVTIIVTHGVGEGFCQGFAIVKGVHSRIVGIHDIGIGPVRVAHDGAVLGRLATPTDKFLGLVGVGVVVVQHVATGLEGAIFAHGACIVSRLWQVVQNTDGECV